MPDELIPKSTREFIARHLRTVEQLEILLLVSGDQPGPWTAQRVYDSILSSVPSVQRWLEEFDHAGFVERDSANPESYRYLPDAPFAVEVGELGRLYKTIPVRIIEAIYKRDVDPAQQFADAFKLKPEN